MGSFYEPPHTLQLVKVRKRRFASACGRLINSAKTMDEIEYSKTALVLLMVFITSRRESHVTTKHPCY